MNYKIIKKFKNYFALLGHLVYNMKFRTVTKCSSVQSQSVQAKTQCLYIFKVFWLLQIYLKGHIVLKFIYFNINQGWEGEKIGIF